MLSSALRTGFGDAMAKAKRMKRMEGRGGKEGGGKEKKRYV